MAESAGNAGAGVVLAVLVWLLVAGGQEHRAPVGWYCNGVRPDGRYEFRPVLGRPEMDLEDARARRQIADDRRSVGWIWCWRPATPRQDGSRVWCIDGR